jgi:hypothetical protein
VDRNLLLGPVPAATDDFERTLLWLSLLRMRLSDVPFYSFVSCTHHGLCTPK